MDNTTTLYLLIVCLSSTSAILYRGNLGMLGKHLGITSYTFQNVSRGTKQDFVRSQITP